MEILPTPFNPSIETGNLARRQHDLAETLHKCVAGGMQPDLIWNNSVLRQAAGLGEVYSDKYSKDDGYTIRHFIEQSISRVEDDYYSLRGDHVPAPLYRRGARVLLRYEQGGKRAPQRRFFVVDELGLSYTAGTFRRQPQVDFFLHLAAVIY